MSDIKHGLHGKLLAIEGKREQLADILLRAAAQVGELPGCRLYAVSLDESEPNAVFITEIWDSKEAHGASLQLPGVRALIAEAMPLLDGAPSGGQQLQVLGGHGV